MFEREAVVAIVRHERNILLGKKKEGGNRVTAGKWHIPGETLESGEDDIAALKRGMLEEAGIVVEPGKLLGVNQPEKGTQVRWYECSTENTEIVAGGDLVDVMWVPIAEVVAWCDEMKALWPKEVTEYFEV